MSDENVQSPTFNLQFDCPDCGGVLLPIQEGGFTHFQCEVGHRYSPETLLNAQHESTEYAMWEALRGTVETNRLLREFSAQDGQWQNLLIPDLEWQLQQNEKVIAILRQALTEFNIKRDGTA